jgi:hypothetical protein
MQSSALWLRNDTIVLPSTAIQYDNQDRRRCFCFLGYPNVVEDVAMERSEGLPIFNTTELSPFLRNITKIYTNGGSEIYYEGEK